MLSRQLSKDLSDAFSREAENNRFLKRAKAGSLSANQLGMFLENSRFLISHTPTHFKKAADALEGEPFRFVREYFLEHAEEEVGHDKWAASDLASLGIAEAPRASESVKLLVAHIETSIAQNPISYMGHVYFAECIAVVAGPSVVSWLTTKCNFPLSSLSVLVKHVELDVNHIQLDQEIIDRICTVEPAQAISLSRVFCDSATAYFRMCDDCASS